ncbi:uncharacterized protein LOC108260619 [Tachysurus ichikawai]
MCRIRTLSSLAELRSSGFGQPAPRHGLRLLYWFVENCVEVNQQNQMILLCIPSTGDFGFRIFHNREEGGKGHLLPDSSNLLYYELGNLSGAESLPEYVREKYTGFQDKSNTDRIVVSLESGMFHSIYVTRHETRINFDHRHTFCIGPELVRTIKKMQREDFLRAAKRRRNTGPRRDMKLLTEQMSEFLAAHRTPSHQPYSQDLQLHTAPHLRHHPHKDTRNISIFCFSLLFLLTYALLLGFIQ